MEDKYSLVDQAHNKKEGVVVASGKEMSVCNMREESSCSP